MSTGGSSVRGKPAVWAGYVNPSAGRITTAIGTLGSVVAYSVLVSILVLCGRRGPSWLEAPAEALLLYLFVDVLGWLNNRAAKNDSARMRNQVWLLALAVVFLAAFLGLWTLRALTPPGTGNG